LLFGLITLTKILFNAFQALQEALNQIMLAVFMGNTAFIKVV